MDVASSSHSLCEYCRRVNINSIISTGPVDPSAGRSQVGLQHQPTYAHLQKSSGSCRLCALLIEVLRQKNLDRDIPQGYIEHQRSHIWLLAGTTSFSDVAAPRGLFHTVVHVGRGSVMNAGVLNIRAEPDDPLALRGDVIGKKIPEQCPAEYCARLITRWLYECESRHPRCRQPVILSKQAEFHPCHPQLSDGVQEEPPLPPRLLDVGGSAATTLHLQETDGARGRYCALSYSWGRSKSFRTHKATYRDRVCGFALKDLPTTIQDAVSLTRCLRFQYLWVDALCIVQDDKADWAKNSAIMDRIYGFATITIAASNCDDKWQSVFRQRPLREYVRLVSPCSDETSKCGALALSHRDGIFEDIFKVSALASRSWTLQERVLSRRIVHFTKEQIFWECQQCGLAEDGSTFDKSFSSRMFLPPTGSSPMPNLQQMLARWRVVVDDYSQRRLFAASDKLPALAGLAHQFQQLISASYLAGLWQEELPLGLLWTIHTSSLGGIGHSVTDWRAPSWSWASIDGGVHCDGFQGLVLTTSSALPVEQLEILESEISLKDESNPFGEITKGVLHVRGKIQNLSRTLERAQHRAKSGRAGTVPLGYPMRAGKGAVIFDNETNTKVGVPMEFMCLLVDKRQDDEGQLVSAFLVVGEIGNGHYRRLGAGYVEGNTFFDASRTDTLILV